LIVPRATTQHARLALARKTIVVCCLLIKEFRMFEKISRQKSRLAGFLPKAAQKLKSITDKREKCRVY
jgi:hypothetical protein